MSPYLYNAKINHCLLANEKDKLESELTTHKTEAARLTALMNGLKKELYGKFGDQINLERE